MKRVVKRLAAFLLVVSMLAGLVVNAAVADTDVAKIGDTGYATIDEALAAAVAGDTVVLLKDVTLAGTFTMKADAVITVDTAGHTFTFGASSKLAMSSVNDSNLVFTGNGTVDMTQISSTAKWCYVQKRTGITFSHVAVNMFHNSGNRFIYGADTTAYLRFDNATVNIESKQGVNASATYGMIKDLTVEIKDSTFSFYGSGSKMNAFVACNVYVDNSELTIQYSNGFFTNSAAYIRNNSTVTAVEDKAVTLINSGSTATTYIDNTSEVSAVGYTIAPTVYVADGAVFTAASKNTTAVAIETLNADGTIAGFYTTVDAAKAATTGIYKVVDTDVLEGVTLDLAGETWIIDEYTAVSASQKIIDTVGGGVLKCEKLNLYGSNGYYMPLFNETKGGYNLFAFGVAMVDGDVDKVGNTTRFWYNLSFPDAAAYDLIATGKSKVNFGADVVCGNANLDVTFSDSTSANSFAAGWAVAAKGNNALYMYTGITNLDAQSGKTLNLTPTMEISGQTVEIPLGTIEYVVQ